MNDILVSLLSVLPQEEGKLFSLQIELSNGQHTEKKSLLLLAEDYEKIGAQVGTLNDEIYNEIERADSVCRAVLQGERFLSFAPNTAKALVSKLMRKGYSKDTSQVAVNWLVKNKILMENADMEGAIFVCLQKKWGKKRIVSHLYEKGYSQENIATIDDYLQEVDFAENCKQLILQKAKELPKDQKEKEKLTAFLLRSGYTFSEIKEAYSMLKKGE